MSGRTTKTLIASTTWGDFEYVTAGNYSVAGVIQYYSDGRLVRKIATVGNSHASVTTRARRALRISGSASYDYNVQVVSLTERTAPILHKYFGTHRFTICEVFKPGEGWTKVSYHPGRSLIRILKREGVTAVAARQAGGNPADFQMDELVKSMNAREGK